MPQALWWDHNAYYHPWLLSQLPARMNRALDVGCGAGALARRLSERADQVDAIDISPGMIDRARAASAHARNIEWMVGDLLETDLSGRYDVVTAVSSLHHMPLRPALTRMADLLKPGGTLAVVGLYRHATPTDYALDVLALPANGVVGLARAARARAGKPYDEGMPVKDPTTSLADVNDAADELLPGVRIRRRLFWRYTLAWQRPG